jgi:hypothetical protein
VHALALLSTGPARQAETVASLRRARLLARCAAPAELLFPVPHQRRATPNEAGFHREGDLYRWSSRHLESFFTQLYEMLNAGHPLGTHLFANLSHAEVLEEAAALHRINADIRREAAAAAAAAAAADRCGAADSSSAWLAPLPPLPRRRAVVSAITVSRIGQFTCPLSSGAVYLATVCGNGVSADRSVLEALLPGGCSADGAASLAAVELLSRNRLLPPIAARGEALAGRWVIFRPCHADADAEGLAAAAASPSMLWPLVWFQFYTREEAAAQVLADDVARAAFEADEDVFDRLHIPLGNVHHCGNAVMINLIRPEDLMAAVRTPPLVCAFSY